MKIFFGLNLTAIFLIAAMHLTAGAQVLAPNRPAARSDERGTQSRIEESNKRTNQQINTANTIETVYLVGFQTQVGLNEEQSIIAGPLLRAYIRQQLMLVDRKTNMRATLENMVTQGAPPEEIQEQVRLLDQVDAQLQNRERKFYADIDPKLTVLQRAKLRIFLYQTSQKIQKRVQESAH